MDLARDPFMFVDDGNPREFHDTLKVAAEIHHNVALFAGQRSSTSACARMLIATFSPDQTGISHFVAIHPL